MICVCLLVANCNSQVSVLYILRLLFVELSGLVILYLFFFRIFCHYLVINETCQFRFKFESNNIPSEVISVFINISVFSLFV